MRPVLIVLIATVTPCLAQKHQNEKKLNENLFDVEQYNDRLFDYGDQKQPGSERFADCQAKVRRLREQCVEAMADARKGGKRKAGFHAAQCEGTFTHHLQGICTDQKDAVYWSFTTTLVKSDLEGKVLERITVANHHGGLCYQGGRVYVAVNLGKFNDPNGNADSWVYAYDADDLSFLEKHEIQEVFYGAGGIGFRDGHFLVVGGLPEEVRENYVYEYDADFTFVKRHVLKSGHTHLGIQTASFANGSWWFGCYGNPPILLKADESFHLLGRYEFAASLGIVGLPNGELFVARGSCHPQKGCVGEVLVADADEEKGLVIKSERERTVPK